MSSRDRVMPEFVQMYRVLWDAYHLLPVGELAVVVGESNAQIRSIIPHQDYPSRVVVTLDFESLDLAKLFVSRNPTLQGPDPLSVKILREFRR